ncbi:MAG: Gfo/Idh/MocA family oxidoreductase [Armatimonadetes bacterium]|nr:Gfo/Idh/MocA family oxidoreductase [Armatimonadota bacterium]
MSEVLNLALVGCGGMMGAHRRGLQLLWEAGYREFRVVGCCDIDEGKAAAMADGIAEFQGDRPRVYADLEAMLAADSEIQAVDLSLVHRDHHRLAVPALQAGKHVIIEKPLAITMRAGKLILDAAQEADKVLAVAENYRRSPEMRAIKWAVSQGRVGEVRMIFWIDIGERLWYWTWREHKDQAGGGWPLDGGVHFADLFRYHVGPVREVSALVRGYYPFRHGTHDNPTGEAIPVDVEDTTLATMAFDGDVTGTWISTSAAPMQGFNRRAIYGSEGCLDFGGGLKTREEEVSLADLTGEYTEQLDDAERERLFPHGVTDTVGQELCEFIRACLHGTSVETDGLEGYKASAICFALYESQALGRPVSTEEIENLEVEVYQREINEGLGLA